VHEMADALPGCMEGDSEPVAAAFRECRSEAGTDLAPAPAWFLVRSEHPVGLGADDRIRARAALRAIGALRVVVGGSKLTRHHA
jgi:hypothetical protein